MKTKRIVVSVILMLLAFAGIVQGGAMLLKGLPSAKLKSTVNAATSTQESFGLAASQVRTINMQGLNITGIPSLPLTTKITSTIYTIKLQLDNSTNIVFQQFYLLEGMNIRYKNEIVVNGAVVKSGNGNSTYSSSIVQVGNALEFRTAPFTYSVSVPTSVRKVTVSRDSTSFSNPTVNHITWKYNLTFEYLNSTGSAWTSTTSVINEDTTLTTSLAPAIPTVIGQVFLNWQTTAGNSINQLLRQDTTFRAVYTAAQYTVTYRLQDGTILETKTIIHGEAISNRAFPPHPDGWVPSHWESSGANVGDAATGNVVLTAVYNEPAPTIVQVTFQYLDLDGLTWLSEARLVEQNTLLAAQYFPAVPNIFGMTLSHWASISGSAAGAEISQDTVLRAVYQVNEYTVTYRYNNQTIETRTLSHGSVIPNIAPPAPQYGFTFSHWQSDSALNVGQYITRSVVLTAVYVELLNFRVRFISPSGSVLHELKVYPDYTEFLAVDDIPTFTSFVPPLYRFAGWRTQGGFWASAFIAIMANSDFYPIMEQNFDWGGRVADGNDITSAYQSGSYNNEILASDFADVYKLRDSSGKQQISDPYLLDKFEIQNMIISPYAESYFSFELQWNSTDLILTQEQWNTQKQYLVLKSVGDKVYLVLGPSISTIDAAPETWKNKGAQVLWEFKFSSTSKSEKSFVKSVAPGINLTENELTFSLFIVGSRMYWSIDFGLVGSTGTARNCFSDVLPGYAFQYDLNKTEYCLGLTGVIIYRSNKMYANYHYYNVFPRLAINGRYAIEQKAVECYIEGEYAFTFYSSVNSYIKPILPAGLERDEEVIEWYLDAAFTRKLLSDHTARDYNKLYGKWIPAQYDVTLEYFTTDRFYDSGHQKYYEALTRKRVTVTYLKGEVIDIEDFGTNIYYSKFYDNIRAFPFESWDTDITAPVMGDVLISGIYTWPKATLYYYDVSDKLYGTVKQDFTLFPADILKEELARLKGSDEYPSWIYEVKPNTGLVGSVVGFFDGILRGLFGTDAVADGQLDEIQRKQRQDAYYIINQLADSHRQNNWHFLPVVFLDINLEQLNKGAYGNKAFNVEATKNPQWHLISGHAVSNDLVYYIDVHSMYSLGSAGNFNMVINFVDEMSGFDAMAKAWEDAIGWATRMIFAPVKGFITGLFGSFDTGMIVIAVMVLLCIFCWPVVAALFSALFSILSFPFLWLAGFLKGLVK